MQLAGITRCSMRRSAERNGEVEITRRGATISLALRGRRRLGGHEIQAIERTFRCASAGLAREAIRYYRGAGPLTRDWHPFRRMTWAIEAADAARWQATKRARGRRLPLHRGTP
jgi:hypothetical protein